MSDKQKALKTKGYSLWLMPTGGAYDKFSGIIKRLAEEYNAPLFEPHITLIGEIMRSEDYVLKRAKQLALGQNSFPITLNIVDYQDFYFRTLFIRAERTNLLQALHDRAKEMFGMENIPDYMPHLSVMYGNFPRAIKEQIIKDIGRDQATEFTVNSVHLFKTDGEVNGWYKVKEFPLS